jgi:antitoxin component YwqK of YwqJK toxin-antitoxin module
MKKVLVTFLAVAAYVICSAQSKVKSEYWPNGTKMSEGAYNKEVSIAANASKAEIATKTQDVYKVGKWIFWHQNGQLAGEQYYGNNGEMIGLWKTWYDNGQMESEIDLNAQKATYWFKNGQKAREGGMLPNMIMVGKWVYYHEGGTKNAEGAYDNNGQRTGEWLWYDDKGNVYSKEVFKNGVKMN